jgi:hypothetical protein
MDIEEKKELSKWEMVYLDTSGTFSIRSARGFHYYSVFVTERMARRSSSVTRKRHIFL